MYRCISTQSFPDPAGEPPDAVIIVIVARNKKISQLNMAQFSSGFYIFQHRLEPTSTHPAVEFLTPPFDIHIDCIDAAEKFPPGLGRHVAVSHQDTGEARGLNVVGSVPDELIPNGGLIVGEGYPNTAFCLVLLG